MDAVDASRLLTEQMPLDQFTPNQTYRIFASQSGDAEDSVPAPGRPGKQGTGDNCAGDHCFGATLIHWRKNLGSCARDVRIGIIDTSFDTSHPALTGSVINRGHFLDTELPSPYDWHGTAIFALLAGDAKSGTPGLVPDAKFYLATAFRTDENGNASTDTVSLLKALDWLEAVNVQFVNMSFSGPQDALVERAIARMSKNGVVFIAAAGNQGPTAPPSYPAAYSQVVAVTAVNKRMESYRFANRGSYVDVAAPGVEIWTALPNGKQGFRTGTSFAAPFVTAILAARRDLRVSPLEKREMLGRLSLQDLGPPGQDPIYGRGLALASETCTGPSADVAMRTMPAPPQQMLVGAVSKSSW
jgi:subtilisin family serine protease